VAEIAFFQTPLTAVTIPAMILDQLLHAERYKNIHPRMRIGLDTLLAGKLGQSPDGRYELLGAEVFALVQTYDSKPRSAGKWEAHRKYTDIQYIVEGSEVMGCAPLAELHEVELFDVVRDVGFCDGSVGNFFKVSAGEFAVFFPHDAHMPSLAIAAPARVKKVVIKLALPE